MTEKSNSFIENIQKGIDYFSVDLFVDNSDKRLIESCKAFLKHKGYKIVDPISDKINISSTKDLVDLFYNLKEHNHPEERFVHKNMSTDLRIVRLFVEARMGVGNIIKEQALKECALIIQTLFMYEKEFKFKYPITLSVLGQKKAGWITKKALEIMDRTSRNRKEREAEELRQAVLDNQDLNTQDFNDFDDILRDAEKERINNV